MQDTDPTPRLQKSFKVNQTSLKLLMFHSFFVRNIARKPGMSLAQVSYLYDRVYGMPTSQLENALVRACQITQKLNSWRYVIII